MARLSNRSCGPLWGCRPCRIVLIVLIAGAAALLLVKPRARWTEVKKSRLLMGTLVTITVRGPHAGRNLQAVSSALDKVEELDHLLSNYDPESELSWLNREAYRGPVTASEQTFEVISRAGEFHRASHGAFDITVPPIIALWRNAAQLGRMPREQDIRDTLRRVGFQNVLLDHASRTVRFRVEGMELDLGGIAKGYAADAAAEVLRRNGVRNAIIDAGGDLGVLGVASPRRPWTVGIQNPDEPGEQSRPLALLKVSDRGVATSGPYYRFYEIEGRRFSHIIDPSTGWPAEGVPSVTVIARDGTTADAWATALSVLGVARGLEAVESQADLEALFLVKREGAWEAVMSQGFGQYLSGELDQELLISTTSSS